MNALRNTTSRAHKEGESLRHNELTTSACVEESRRQRLQHNRRSGAEYTAARVRQDRKGSSQFSRKARGFVDYDFLTRMQNDKHLIKTNFLTCMPCYSNFDRMLVMRRPRSHWKISYDDIVVTISYTRTGPLGIHLRGRVRLIWNANIAVTHPLISPRLVCPPDLKFIRIQTTG